MLSYLLFFLLFLLQFVIFPFGTSYFEIPKVLLAEIVIEFGLLLTILNWHVSVISFFKKRYIPLLMLFLLTIFDLIFLSSQTAFFGNIFRLQGIFLLWHMFILCLLASITFLPNLPEISYFLLFLIYSLASLLINFTQSGRAIGSIGEPNSLAAGFLFLWPFMFFTKKISTQVKFFIIFITGTMIFFTGSRSGFLGLSIQLIFIGLIFYRKVSFKLSLLISIFLIATSFALPFFDMHRGIWENRAEIWQTAWEAGLQRPLLGSGFGNIEYALSQTAEKKSNNLRFEYVDSSHNLLLDFWVGGGTVGVVLLLLILSMAFKNFYIHNRSKEVVLLLGTITAMCFNPVSIIILVQFWWLLGRGLSDLVVKKK